MLAVLFLRPSESEMGDTSFEVKIHVYDLSKGLARQLSPMLLGKQIDGVWHTGVVVYGREYFFGSMGIAHCPPCGTMLGAPDEVIDMGRTQVPRDLFEEYLDGLGADEFRGSAYRLLEHNCNNFSSEVATFLTGSPIPAHITNLPSDVMNTPFGASIRPLLESFSVAPQSSVSLSDLPAPYVHGQTPSSTASGTSSATAAQPTSAHVQPASTQAAPSHSHPTSTQPAPSQPASAQPTESVRLETSISSLPRSPAQCTRAELHEMVDSVLRAGDELDLPTSARSTLSKVSDSLHSDTSSWPQPEKDWSVKSLTRVTGEMMTRGTLASKTPDAGMRVRLQTAGMQVLSVLLVVPGGAEHYVGPRHLLMRLLNACEAGSKKSVELQHAVLAMMAQLASTDTGRHYATSSQLWSMSPQREVNNVQLCTPLLVDGVLSRDDACALAAVRAVHNFSLEKLPSGTALELGTALAEAFQHFSEGGKSKPAELVVLSLARLCACSDDLCSLLPALGQRWTVSSSDKSVELACKLLSDLVLADS